MANRYGRMLFLRKILATIESGIFPVEEYYIWNADNNRVWPSSKGGLYCDSVVPGGTRHRKNRISTQISEDEFSIRIKIHKTLVQKMLARPMGQMFEDSIDAYSKNTHTESK